MTTQNQDISENADVQITMEDLNALFAKNPLALEQFNGILKEKRIAQLEEQLKEVNGNVTDINSIPSIDSDS